jgi:YesN/AraC family two-component response regulator
MKLLVVDDEQDVQLLFLQKFRKELRAGMLEMDFAFSGESALEHLGEEDDPSRDLVLSDINMPGMNGIELLKIIKARYPQLPVFMITAYGDEEYYNSAMANGADDYIIKPIEFNQLKTKLTNIQ